MDLHHFFENMVRREETASAFLATLLEYNQHFRLAFLRAVLDAPTYEDSADWAVRVEAGQVDVTLESDSMRVLIENKLRAGAKQQGQLLRYYLAAVEAVPQKRLVAVYLAPGGMGLGEVELVVRSDARASRSADVASHLPWDDVAAIIDALPASDHAWFARSGMREIDATIKRARQELPAVGVRGEVRGIFDDAVLTLRQEVPGVRLGRWVARDSEWIQTEKSLITVYLTAIYDVEGVAPYEPIGVVQPNGLRLLVRCQFRLSGRGRKVPQLRQRWSELEVQQAVVVPEVGPFALRPGGWFTFEADTIAGREGMTRFIVDVGRSVIEYLKSIRLDPSST